MQSLTNLRSFIQLLRSHKEIVDVHAEVDPTLELAEIHRRVIENEGPALFFHNVKGSSFPVVTNLFGTKKRISLGFNHEPEKLIERLVKLATTQFPPSLKVIWENRSTLKKLLKIGVKKAKRAPVCEVKMQSCDLERLPLLKLWPQDGGHFITLPLVYTEHPLQKGAPNLGMYRIQRYDKTTTGLHFQIGKGGGFHYKQAEEKNAALPVSIFIGGSPALILSAICPLPENVPEILLASLIQGEKMLTSQVEDSPHPIYAESEFALIGASPPHQRRLEGPFGDHYGYYSLEHEFPIFNCKAIYHRKDAIYPATVVGKPRQEDFFIGDYLQELLSPLFPVVMPGVKALWSYGETGFHSLAAAIIHERYYRESMVSAFRILGEGQLSFTKFLLLTDQTVDLKNFKEVLTTVLERFKPEVDLFIFANLSLDTLDYTGPELNKGSRGVFLGVGEKVRTLPQVFHGKLPSRVSEAIPFCPGCLVIEALSYAKFQDFYSIVSHLDFSDWPLLVLVDDAKKATRSLTDFLWITFTRFEPAADIHAKMQPFRHHLSYSGPILIDARMKPSYPPEVECDDKTKKQVNERWKAYFPKEIIF